MAAETVLDRLLRESRAGGAGAPPVPYAPKQYDTNIVLGQPVGGSVKQDDGFDAGDIFKPLGKLAMGALRTVDAPRAAVVSAVRELADAFDPNEDASWSDFKDQFNRRAGAQELLFTGPHFSLDEKGWEDEIFGFLTDVILDPLTYTPGVFAKQAIKIGGAGMALTKAEKAMRVAVQDGSAKVIGKTLATNAFEAGLKDAPEVQKLVTLAAAQGRGGLTERTLREAGVTAEQRLALGLPAEGTTGGARRLLQSVENVKGTAKQSIRETAASKLFRAGFVPQTGGRLALTNIAFDKAATFGRRADSVLASATINASKEAANRWGAETMLAIGQEFIGTRKAPGLLRNMSVDELKTLTRNVEAGVDGPLENVVRERFRAIREDLKRRDVDVGDLGADYMPHQRTLEVIELAKKNEEVRSILSSFNTKEGFQKFRTLRPGDNFLNDTQAAARQAAEAGTENLGLLNGSIDEINERFREKFGINLFIDDVSELLPNYVKQGERAVFRSTQVRLLTELGFTEGLATRMARRAEVDEVHGVRIQKVKDRIKEEQDRRTVRLKDGSTIRRSNLLELKRIAAKRKGEIEARVKQIEDELTAFGDRRTEALARIEDNDMKIALLRQEVEDLTAAAKAARGNERRGLQARRDRAIRARDAQVPELQADIRKIQDEVARMFAEARTPQQQRSAARRSAQARQSVEGLQAERNALLQTAQGLQNEYDELVQLYQQSGLGLLPNDLEGALFDASDILESYIKMQPKLLSEQEFADTVFLFAQADARFSIDALNRQIAELDAVKQVEPPKKVPSGEVGRDSLREKFNTVKTVLERQDNSPEVQAIAKLEAAAAAADMDALMSKRQIDLMERMLKEMEDEKVEVIADRARAGMIRVGEQYEMPEWLFEATKLDWLKTELPLIGKFGRKYFNLFKGYAILRPGFHVRNLYSAFFNMYLEAGARSFKNVKKWHEFYTLATHNPEGYFDEAAERFGLREATLLNQAYGAISATGAGQVASEFSVGALRKASKSPFDENNIAFQTSRRWGGWVEDHVRGAHAYDVLKRGGTMDQAVDIVTKWHFDYTDVTKFDQWMKLVNPFWIFFSRNMALQSKAWLGTVPKLNRTIINFERNMNYGLQEDGIVPEYYHTEGAIRLPFKGYQGSSLYFFSDLPAITYPGELDRVSDVTSPRFLADLGPFLKIPVEAMFKRQLFSDIPIDVTKPQELPFGVGSIPGAGNLGFLPGLNETGSGRLVADPRLMNAIGGALPGLGQLQRLAPVNDPKLLERLPYTALSTLLGISLVENTPRAQQGELYRRSLELQEQQELQRRLAGL